MTMGDDTSLRNEQRKFKPLGVVNGASIVSLTSASTHQHPAVMLDTCHQQNRESPVQNVKQNNRNINSGRPNFTRLDLVDHRTLTPERTFHKMTNSNGGAGGGGGGGGTPTVNTVTGAGNNRTPFVYRQVTSVLPLGAYTGDGKAILVDTPPESPKVHFSSAEFDTHLHGHHPHHHHHHHSHQSSAFSRLVISLLLAALLLTLLVLTGMLIAQHRTPSVCQTMHCVEEAATIIKSLNMDVSPCDDFYEFTCGGWIRDTPIPDHKPSRSRFDHVNERLQTELKVILEAEVQEDDDPDYVIKMKQFYHSCLNTSAIEAKGDRPLRRIIERLGGWPVLEGIAWDARFANRNFDFVSLQRSLQEIGVIDDMLISLGVTSHSKNNSLNIIGLSAPTFGLLDRDMMIQSLEEDIGVQRYYRMMLYTAKLLSGGDFYEHNKFPGAGAPIYDFTDFDPKHFDNDIDLPQQMKKDLRDVLLFEQDLAKHSMKRDDNMNITLLFNNMTINELQRFSPKIQWLELINGLSKRNFTSQDEIIVTDMNYIAFVGEVIDKTPVKVLQNYVLWRVIKQKSSALNSAYRTMREQYKSALVGRTRTEPRWMFCIGQVQDTLGTALSNLYVKTFFTKHDKAAIMDIVTKIRTEFNDTLRTLEWMDGNTKANAMSKLDSMQFRIGFPDELLDQELISNFYRMFNVSSNDYFNNTLESTKFFVRSNFESLDEENYRDDWRKFSEVIEVNAYYYHQENSFILNAAILQGIFFNPHRPQYLNYGAIGEVIGHEITHGFDNLGRQFDSEGHINSWWNPETSKMYENKAECIQKQYDNYAVPEAEMNVNGLNTENENIADNGGVGLAYRTYMKSVVTSDQSLPGLTNYTAEQMFWISYGISNCEKFTREMLRFTLQTDSHAPPKFRVNGVVSNSHDFSRSFGCPKGSQMNPVQKCKVW